MLACPTGGVDQYFNGLLGHTEILGWGGTLFNLPKR